MESFPVQDSPQESSVMVQQDSGSSDCPASSTDSSIAASAVPNPREEETPRAEVSSGDSPVKFNQPDFTYLEISSRLSQEESCDYPMTSGQASAQGLAEDPLNEPSSSIGNLPGSRDSKDVESVVSYETLFSEESRLATPACEFAPSRKRQCADFLPINAEIKRIGIEISEEQAKQLKNDVRRLSPVLVSLRERTLGEISLTSDSGLFEDGDRACGRGEESAADGGLRSSERSEPTDLPIPPESVGPLELPEMAPLCQDSASISAEVVSSSSSPIPEEPKSETAATRHDEGPTDLPEDDEPDRAGSPITSPSAATTPSQGSNAQRELVIVLSRVDRGNLPGEAGRNEVCADRVVGNGPTDDCEVPGGPAAPLNDTVIGGVEKDNRTSFECTATVKDRQAVVNTADSSAVLVGNVCLSPKYHDNDQLRRKSPKVVIERTLEGSASLSGKHKSLPNEESLLGVNLDRVRRSLEDSLDDEDDEEDDASLSDPLAINEDTSAAPLTTGSDPPESLDTETENGSLIEPTSSTCPETDSLVSDETPTRDAITRLEPERPEAFTEDSAESLALASGARDEVRSDGSDSGLGSEIPGDPGIAPAPESDSETSFLDRIPDDILSDKDKVVNPLEAFVPDPGTSGIQQQHQEIHHHHQQQPQQLPLPSFPNPPKSSLKRRLTDCMEGEPSPKRINTDEPVRKKRNIQFDAVTVYYFPRAQGFTCVPSQGGSTLGMSATHTHAERFSLTEHAAEQRRLHRARLAQLRSERAANCGTEAASSSEDPSDDTDEEPSDAEELDIDSYYFLQPVPTWQRRALLRAAGVRRIDAIEKDDCRDIRASREHCGCGCKGYCDPESCPCSRANVKCQVDRAGFPCGCSRDGCANSSGRIEFNPVRVRTHFIHTLMRLQLEKKQRDEERTEHDLLMNSPVGRGPMREVPGMMASPMSQMEHPSVITGDPVSCVNANGFTTLHYDAHDQAPNSSCASGIVHPVREDSLDLYAIRDDCYPPADETEAASARKLHPEFGQAFQPFPGQQPAVNFPQTAYQDYQGYQTLASTSRSQYQPQFQAVQPANPNFAHYQYGQETGLMQPSCQSHQPVPTHHTSVYETGFTQEDPAGSQQHYTNLNSVQPINAVVQQMGKLEPFSELLAGRYSYYGEPEPQPVPVAAYHNSPAIAKLETDKIPGDEQQPENGTEDCDENFGEIIKKSMVETVSA